MSQVLPFEKENKPKIAWSFYPLQAYEIENNYHIPRVTFTANPAPSAAAKNLYRSDNQYEKYPIPTASKASAIKIHPERSGLA